MVLYAIDKGLHGQNVLQLVVNDSAMYVRICSQSVHPRIHISIAIGGGLCIETFHSNAHVSWRNAPCASTAGGHVVACKSLYDLSLALAGCSMQW